MSWHVSVWARARVCVWFDVLRGFVLPPYSTGKVGDGDGARWKGAMCNTRLSSKQRRPPHKPLYLYRLIWHEHLRQCWNNNNNNPDPSASPIIGMSYVNKLAPVASAVSVRIIERAWPECGFCEGARGNRTLRNEVLEGWKCYLVGFKKSIKLQ